MVSGGLEGYWISVKRIGKEVGYDGDRTLRNQDWDAGSCIRLCLK